MSDRTYNFSGGVDAVTGFGQRGQLVFTGTWSDGDTWSVEMAATVENAFRIGAGNLLVDKNQVRLSAPTCCFTYKNRVYLGVGTQFNFSDVADPTGWEEQNPGAGFILYISQYGGQDTVNAFGQLQGRLAVIGRRTVQFWITDADPTQFSNPQTLDNIGTAGPLTVINVGDYDTLMLDDTGVRSLRWREFTANADVDDLGIAIDGFIQNALLTTAASTACAIVDPTSKRYWLYLAGNIYVFSRYRSSKIAAWSTYLVFDQNNNQLTPVKFVVFNNRVYIRTFEGQFVLYGGSDNNTFDGTIVTIQTPWLDDKNPNQMKQAQGVDVAVDGGWQISLGMDPASGTLTPVYTVATPAGDETKDSSFDLRNFAYSAKGTHFKLQAKTLGTWTNPATFSELSFHYNKASK